MRSASSSARPSLEAISPLSTLDATATTLYPGGILNNGFARTEVLQRFAGVSPPPEVTR